MSQTEFELIRRYFTDSGLGFDRGEILLGIGDDAAVVQVPDGHSLLMSMDVLVEGVHFPVSACPSRVANKALAVNLSDMAAMGADPLCFTLGLVLPKYDEQWLEKFSEGLKALALQHNCPLVGGDVSRGPLTISIQIQGTVETGSLIKRSGASVGDTIYVTGKLGDAAIALPAMGIDSHLGSDFKLESAPADQCIANFESAYYEPESRVEFASQIASLVSAGIDISDGLYGDLGHILEASAVAAKIDTSKLPYSDSALCCMSDSNRLRAALLGGDDYELCLTVPQENSAKLESIAAENSVQLTPIGEILAGSGLDLSGVEVAMPTLGSFDHFRISQ